MNAQDIPTILIAYPKDFSCYTKFERKVSNIISNFTNFHITYSSDESNFITEHLLSDERLCDDLSSSFDMNDLSGITHAIIFNDGETFDELINNAKIIGIKSKIIDIVITKVVNIDKVDKYDVYIGRGSTWGNPYAIGFDGDRNEVIRKFEYDFSRDFFKFSKTDTLRIKGKILGCHCKPSVCHGDVIAEYLNSFDDGK